MYLYSATYLINSLGFFICKKDRRIINFIVVALLIFICGTRYYMGGSDVLIYENVYNTVAPVGKILKYMFTGVNNGVNTNYEVGYLLICSVFKSLHFSYFGFTLIYTIIFYTLMVMGLRDFVPNWAPFFALFMYKIMFYNNFISIRQGLTIAIFCFLLRFIRDKKWYFYFPLAYIAFLVHRGAFFIFLLYFVQYIPLTKDFVKWTAVLFAPTWLIRNFVNIGGLLEKFINLIGFSQKSEGWTETTEPISFIHTLECYIIVMLVLMFYEKIISNARSREAKLVLQLFLVAIPIFTLLSNWIVMTRLKDYIVLFYGVIFGYILDGGTTAIPTEQIGINGNNNTIISDRGQKEWLLITVIIILACFIGMARYVMVFDGGVLKNFESFIFKGGSLFS